MTLSIFLAFCNVLLSIGFMLFWVTRVKQYKAAAEVWRWRYERERSARFAAEIDAHTDVHAALERCWEANR